MQIKENRHISWLTAVLAAVLAALCLSGYPHLAVYFDLSDEPYQIMCGWDYRSSVVAPLSAWFTSVVGTWVDYDMLPLRQIGWTFTLLSILAGSLPVWWLTRNVNFSLVTAVIATGLASHCRLLEWMYTWNSLAALPTVLAAAASFRFVIRPGYAPVIAAAIFSAVATLMRLPSIAVGTVTFIAIFATRGQFNNKLRFFITYLAVLSGCILLGLIALYGSVDNYLGYFADNVINEHSPEHMFDEYINHLTWVPFFLFPIVGAVFTADKIFTGRHSLLNISVFIALTVALCVTVFSWAGIIWYILAPVNSAVICALICLLWKLRLYLRSRLGIYALLAAATMLSAAAGSNLVLFNCLTYQVLAVVIALVIITARSWRTVAGWGVVLSAAAIYAWARNYDVIEPHNGTPPPCYPPKTTVDGMRHHDGLVLDYVWTDLLQRIVDNFGPYADSPDCRTIVVRNMPRNFIYEYMFDSRNPVAPHYWSMDNLMDHPDYCRQIEHMADTVQAPAAILLLQNASCHFEKEPELITRFKCRYRTVYSDSTFTIVIKDVNQGK